VAGTLPTDAASAVVAAPGARSWVGWVRVAGAAGVIDALVAWQSSGNFGFRFGRDSAAAPLRRGRFVFGGSGVPGWRQMSALATPASATVLVSRHASLQATSGATCGPRARDALAIPRQLAQARLGANLARRAPVAQWIERLPPEQKAVGSSPAGRASLRPKLEGALDRAEPISVRVPAGLCPELLLEIGQAARRERGRTASLGPDARLHARSAL
jgi:hypothetical protein